MCVIQYLAVMGCYKMVVFSSDGVLYNGGV